MLFAFIATVLFSISVVCAHRTARMVGGLEANFWRLVLATVFLGIWAFTKGQGVSGKAVGFFLLSGVIGIGVADFGLFQALPKMGARLTLLLVLCLTAPFAAAVEWWWLGEGLTPTQIVCSGVILTGVAVTLLPDRRLPIPLKHLVPGVLFCLLAASTGGYAAVLSRKAYAVCAAAGETIDGPTAAFQRVVGGVVIAALLLAVARLATVETGNPMPLTRFADAGEKLRKIGPWVMANALAGLTVGVSFMQKALETTEAGLVMAIIATTPIAVIPIARVVEGERITVKALIGAVIAVAGASGLALVSR